MHGERRDCGGTGRGGAGAPSYRGEMSHLSRVFASPAQPESESPQLTFSAAVQVEAHVCFPWRMKMLKV